MRKLLAERPDNIHEYQGCKTDEDEAMSKHDKHKFRRSEFNGLCNFLNTAGEYCREEEGHSCHIPGKIGLLVCGCVGRCVGHNDTSVSCPICKLSEGHIEGCRNHPDYFRDCLMDSSYRNRANTIL